MFEKVCRNLEKEFGESCKPSLPGNHSFPLPKSLHAPKLSPIRKSRIQSSFPPAGDQYTAILVTDPESEEEDPRGGPRVAFQLAPSSVIQPQESAGWQRGVALVLGALTLATALQLGLTANISKLPQVRGRPGIHAPTSCHRSAPSVPSPLTCACWGLQELVDFIAQPDNLRGELPTEIENYDVLPYFLGALPLAASVLGVQAVHEIAHRVVAATKQVLLHLLSWSALLHT